MTEFVLEYNLPEKAEIGARYQGVGGTILATRFLESRLNTSTYPTLGSLYGFLDSRFATDPLWNKGPGSINVFEYKDREVDPNDTTPIESLPLYKGMVLRIHIPTIMVERNKMVNVFYREGNSLFGDQVVLDSDQYPTIGSLYKYFERLYCPEISVPCNLSISGESYHANGPITPDNTNSIFDIVSGNNQVEIRVKLTPVASTRTQPSFLRSVPIPKQPSTRPVGEEMPTINRLWTPSAKLPLVSSRPTVEDMPTIIATRAPTAKLYPTTNIQQPTIAQGLPSLTLKQPITKLPPGGSRPPTKGQPRVDVPELGAIRVNPSEFVPNLNAIRGYTPRFPGAF